MSLLIKTGAEITREINDVAGALAKAQYPLSEKLKSEYEEKLRRIRFVRARKWVAVDSVQTSLREKGAGITQYNLLKLTHAVNRI
jgi:hypothetical protein